MSEKIAHTMLRGRNHGGFPIMPAIPIVRDVAFERRCGYPRCTMNDAPLRTDDLEYDLPETLIARRPAVPREDARLMVVPLDRDDIIHARIGDFPSFIRSDDALVFNNTTVIPARFEGERTDSGGRIEGLFLGEESNEEHPHAWRVMLRSNSKLRPGIRLSLIGADGTRVQATVGDRLGDHWQLRLNDDRSPVEVLDEVGRTPLPPYILRARRTAGEMIDDADDRAWYQTVFADADQAGSVAAPTAGLHFTPAMLAVLDARGIRRETVTLHVGPGTFKPIESDTVQGHPMHREFYEVPPATIRMLAERRMKSTGGRVIAVGTTTVRTLESLPSALDANAQAPIAGSTKLLIAPPYSCHHVDGLLTNFHLPRSTLLALVAALVGLDRLMACYREAVAEGYRFYSYGDAMLVLPSV
jgi:S-adenosylmethionine:tRNA ribosyltransferase-isomerase